MTPKPKNRRTGGKPLGWRKHPNKDGLSPRERLDARRADIAEMELAEKRGELVNAAEVEAGMREAAEVIQSDLFGALPQRLGGVLAGRALTAEGVRREVIAAVADMVQNWQTADIVAPLANPPQR